MYYKHPHKKKNTSACVYVTALLVCAESELGPAEKILCPDDDSDEVTNDEYEDNLVKLFQQLK